MPTAPSSARPASISGPDPRYTFPQRAAEYHPTYTPRPSEFQQLPFHHETTYENADHGLAREAKTGIINDYTQHPASASRRGSTPLLHSLILN